MVVDCASRGWSRREVCDQVDCIPCNTAHHTRSTLPNHQYAGKHTVATRNHWRLVPPCFPSERHASNEFQYVQRVTCLGRHMGSRDHIAVDATARVP